MKYYGKLLLATVLISGSAWCCDDNRAYVMGEIDKMLAHDDAFEEGSLQRKELELLKLKLDKYFQAKGKIKGRVDQPTKKQAQGKPIKSPAKPTSKQSPDYYDVMQQHGDVNAEYNQVMQFKQQVHDKYLDLQSQLADIKSYQQARQTGQDLSSLKIQTPAEYKDAQNQYNQSFQEHEALKAKYLKALNKYNEHKGMYHEMYNAYGG